MFDKLAQAIRELEVPVDGTALVALFALRDQLDARLAAAVGEFDAAALWELDHATSMTAWLRSSGGLANSAAASTARTAARVRQLPVVADAWRDGELSGGQVTAIVANLNERNVELFASNEAELVPTLAALPVKETALVMQSWKARADALLDGGGDGESDASTLHLSRTFGG